MNKFVFRATVAMLWLAALHLTIWPHIAPANGQTVGGSFNVKDNIPPASITDLSIVDVTSDSITLIWTAPGDDGNQGTASQYDIRCSSSSITTDIEWNTAKQINNIPSPQLAGTSEMLVVTDPNPNTENYFALKTSDEIPNWSGLSNYISAISSENSIGWAAPRLMLNIDGEITTWLIQPNGTLLEDVYAVSTNEDIIIMIPARTQILGPSLNVSNSIKLSHMSTFPVLQSNGDVIAAFNFKPQGSTIEPGMEIYISYDPEMLPQNAHETNLTIAVFDESNEEWRFVNSILDLRSDTIKFSLSRLSRFAVIYVPLTAAMIPEKTTPEATPDVNQVPMLTLIERTPAPSPTAEPMPTDSNMNFDLKDTGPFRDGANENQTPNDTNTRWATSSRLSLLILIGAAISMLLAAKRWRVIRGN